MHFILDAKENGAQYVVIDPFFNANAGKADWYVGVNPATDGALAFGAVNHVLEQGWQDEDFIAARTEAPCFVKEDGTYLRVSDLGVEVAEDEPNELVVWDEAADAPLARSQATKPSLASRSEVEGVSVTLVYDLVKERVAEYPVARAAEISGVSEDDIKKLAQMYAQEGPVTTFTMFGCDRYVNGHFNYWPVYRGAPHAGNMCRTAPAPAGLNGGRRLRGTRVRWRGARRRRRQPGAGTQPRAAAPALDGGDPRQRHVRRQRVPRAQPHGVPAQRHGHRRRPREPRALDEGPRLCGGGREHHERDRPVRRHPAAHLPLLRVRGLCGRRMV